MVDVWITLVQADCQVDRYTWGVFKMKDPQETMWVQCGAPNDS